MKVTSDYTKIGERDFVKYLIPQIVGHGGSFMFWRFPNSDAKTLIVCNAGALMHDEISVEDSKSGFVFAPFNPSKKKLFFNADLVFRFKDNEIIQGLDLNNTKYIFKISEAEEKPKENQTKYYSSEKRAFIHSDITELVEVCIRKIKTGAIEKIVPSK